MREPVDTILCLCSLSQGIGETLKEFIATHTACERRGAPFIESPVNLRRGFKERTTTFYIAR